MAKCNQLTPLPCKGLTYYHNSTIHCLYTQYLQCFTEETRIYAHIHSISNVRHVTPKDTTVHRVNRKLVPTVCTVTAYNVQEVLVSATQLRSATECKIAKTKVA